MLAVVLKSSNYMYLYWLWFWIVVIICIFFGYGLNGSNYAFVLVMVLDGKWLSDDLIVRYVIVTQKALQRSVR